MKIYLAITLDTECDKGKSWVVRQPLTFDNVLEGVPKRLQPLFDAHGIKATYLLSPEVLKDDACTSLFQGLQDRAELGTHLHSEFIGPQDAPETDNTHAFQSDYPPEVERVKLANFTGLFEARLGRAPTSFRAGRFGLSRHTLGFLEDLGYLVDSSVTPQMWWWRRRGEGVNFLGAPDQPYHPSARDFRKPGRMRLVEAPVTVINPFWDRVPWGLRRAINPIHRPQTILLRLLVRRHLRCTWLRPTYATAEEMLEVTEYVVRRERGCDVVLCMMFHSNEATAGASPYHATPEEVARFLDRIESYLVALFERYDAVSIGLTEAREAVKMVRISDPDLCG